MALALESEGRMWQRVKIALLNASPMDQLVFKGLREYMATHKRLPDLQFIPFTSTQLEAVDGTGSLVGSACTLYGVYALAHRTAGTTAAFITVNNAITTDASTTTIITLQINATAQHYAVAIGDGKVFATDISVVSLTTVGGDTASAAGDSADGFIIVGA